MDSPLSLSSSDDEESEQLQNLASLIFQKMTNDGVVERVQKLQEEEENKSNMFEANLSTSDAQVSPSKCIPRFTFNKDLLHNQTIDKIRCKSKTLPLSVDDYHKIKAEKVLKESRLAGNLEKGDFVTPLQSVRQKKKQAREEKSKFSSKGWGAMRAKDQPTDEEKMDLTVLKMRGSLDTKSRYKHLDIKAPKFFQVGTVIDSPVDFHHRMPKKQRKRTMVEELMADAEFRKQTKKKYLEIMDMKRRGQGLYQGTKPPKRHKKKK